MSTLNGATALGPANAYPADAGEFAARWNQRTPVQREALVRLLRDGSERAAQCFQQDHVGRLERLVAAEAKLARIEALCDEMDHYLADSPGYPIVRVEQVRAILKEDA
jgi:hypothetical protein